MTLTRGLAVAAGKLAGLASRRLGRGGGTTVPGVVAGAVDPQLVSELSRELAHGSIAVSGTNGKTTTSAMTAAVFKDAGYHVVHNASGSNLMRGVATALVEHAGWSGHLSRDEKVLGLFEVDEAALPQVAAAARPHTVVLLNLFRDQLDRYGEVATISRTWREALATLPAGTTVVANADDPLLASVVLSAPHVAPLWFGLEIADQGPPDYAGDVKACPRCGGSIRYFRSTYGHLGDYTCGCGFQRPPPAVSASSLESQDFTGTTFTLTAGATSVAVRLPLPGLYNVMNALAASATAVAEGINLDVVRGCLAAFTGAFGRLERVSVDGRTIYLALAKNPAGYNQVLRTIFTSGAHRYHVLFMLNDNTADGRDVSWIWDVDFEVAADRVDRVVCAGTRAEDMALRLKYAGLVSGAGEVIVIERAAEPALRASLASSAPGDTLYFVMTYTAMLDMRATLARLGIVRSSWET